MTDEAERLKEFVVRGIAADVIGTLRFGDVPLDGPIPTGNGQFHEFCVGLNREFPEVTPADIRHCDTLGDVIDVVKRITRP